MEFTSLLCLVLAGVVAVDSARIPLKDNAEVENKEQNEELRRTLGELLNIARDTADVHNENMDKTDNQRKQFDRIFNNNNGHAEDDNNGDINDNENNGNINNNNNNVKANTNYNNGNTNNYDYARGIPFSNDNNYHDAFTYMDDKKDNQRKQFDRIFNNNNGHAEDDNNGDINDNENNGNINNNNNNVKANTNYNNGNTNNYDYARGIPFSNDNNYHDAFTYMDDKKDNQRKQFDRIFNNNNGHAEDDNNGDINDNENNGNINNNNNNVKANTNYNNGNTNNYDYARGIPFSNDNNYHDAFTYMDDKKDNQRKQFDRIFNNNNGHAEDDNNGDINDNENNGNINNNNNNVKANTNYNNGNTNNYDYARGIPFSNDNNYHDAFTYMDDKKDNQRKQFDRIFNNNNGHAEDDNNGDINDNENNGNINNNNNNVKANTNYNNGNTNNYDYARGIPFSNDNNYHDAFTYMDDKKDNQRKQFDRIFNNNNGHAEDDNNGDINDNENNGNINNNNNNVKANTNYNNGNTNNYDYARGIPFSNDNNYHDAFTYMDDKKDNQRKQFDRIFNNNNGHAEDDNNGDINDNENNGNINNNNNNVKANTNYNNGNTNNYDYARGIPFSNDNNYHDAFTYMDDKKDNQRKQFDRIFNNNNGHAEDDNNGDINDNENNGNINNNNNNVKANTNYNNGNTNNYDYARGIPFSNDNNYHDAFTYMDDKKEYSTTTMDTPKTTIMEISTTTRIMEISTTTTIMERPTQTTIMEIPTTTTMPEASPSPTTTTTMMLLPIWMTKKTINANNSTEYSTTTMDTPKTKIMEISTTTRIMEISTTTTIMERPTQTTILEMPTTTTMPEAFSTDNNYHDAFPFMDDKKA